MPGRVSQWAVLHGARWESMQLAATTVFVGMYVVCVVHGIMDDGCCGPRATPRARSARVSANAAAGEEARSMLGQDLIRAVDACMMGVV